MTPETDTPPRRRRKPVEPEAAAPAAAPPPKPPSPALPGLQKRLERMLAMFALPFAAAGDGYCANIIATRASVVAQSWAELAAESPAVKRALEGLLAGGAWTGAIGTTLTMVVPIAAHHGLPVPDPFSAIVLGPDHKPAERAERPPRRRRREANGSAPESPAPSTGPTSYAPPAESDPAVTDPSNYPGVQNADGLG